MRYQLIPTARPWLLNGLSQRLIETTTRTTTAARPEAE
jgi:hypothetical protein